VVQRLQVVLARACELFFRASLQVHVHVIGPARLTR
jgi:hypothetical protein